MGVSGWIAVLSAQGPQVESKERGRGVVPSCSCTGRSRTSKPSTHPPSITDAHQYNKSIPSTVLCSTSPSPHTLPLETASSSNSRRPRRPLTVPGDASTTADTAGPPPVMICWGRGAVQYSTAQHSTAQHSTAQHSTAQHSTAQHSTAQHSKAKQSKAKHRSGQLRQSCELQSC